MHDINPAANSLTALAFRVLVGFKGNTAQGWRAFAVGSAVQRSLSAGSKLMIRPARSHTMNS